MATIHIDVRGVQREFSGALPPCVRSRTSQANPVLPPMLSVRVSSAGSALVNGAYAQRNAVIIPRGFAKVCEEMGWPTQPMWQKLSNMKTPWYEAENGAYIYWNQSDRQWWLDEPNGNGVYVALSDDEVPPSHGWRALPGGRAPVPSVEVEKA